MWRRVYLSLMLVILVCQPIMACAESVQEYELKTAYLYNFALFTLWPQDWSPETGNSMSICTIGQDQFGPALDQLQGRKVREKRLIVHRAVSLEEAHTCHVLYIAVSEQENMAKIYETLRNSSVLTVTDFNAALPMRNMISTPSDSAEIMPTKGIINMTVENQRLVFEVDTTGARQARLVMSSKLLHLAKRVY
jgi:hypothetical protein